MWGNGPRAQITAGEGGPTVMICERESGSSERERFKYSGNFALDEMEKQRCGEISSRLNFLSLLWLPSPPKRGTEARD